MSQNCTPEGTQVAALEGERPHDDAVDVPAQTVGAKVSESSDIDALFESADTVTITISRNLAVWWAFGVIGLNFFERQIQKACRAALETER